MLKRQLRRKRKKSCGNGQNSKTLRSDRRGRTRTWSAQTTGSAEGDASGDHSIYTEPSQAKGFIEKTDVDALAVAIGTAHGAYKEKPKLDIERLKEIAHTVSTPLVLHGGSGLSDDDFRNCVSNGIAKVNIFTDINTAQVKSVVENYKEGFGMTDVMCQASDAVMRATMKKMLVFGSNNRA